MSWSGDGDGAARELLARVGYHRGHVLHDVTAVQDHGATLDLVAYGRALGPHDASTATIAVKFVQDARNVDPGTKEWLAEAATALSVPALIAADTRWWSLYAVEGVHELSLLRELQWVDDIGELREYLSPGALLAAKLGTRQLSLFPAAVEVARQGKRLREQTLGPRVTQALQAAEATLTIADKAKRQAHAARLVIGALTVVVLRDKPFQGGDPPAATGSSDVLVSRAVAQHPRQFDWLTTAGTAERDRLETLVDEFIDIDFGTVEPQMLSVLYENVLVDDSMKRRVGIHYTPPGLARRMLAWLPVEEIEPKDRRVYDPTCGSGTLLVAAHDRICELQSPTLPLAASHQDLVTRIRGGDIDDVAVSIANLSLFLNALPAGNGWQIEKSDVFQTTALPESPTIIVSNPPWQFQRVEHRDDLAQRVLGRLMQWSPAGGLLGVVMPAGWMSWTSASAVTSRTALFADFDVFEVWQLPSGTFEHADLGAAVVLARRKGGQRPPPTRSVRRRISDRSQLSRFYETGVSRALMTDLKPDTLGYGPLRLWWKGNSASTVTVGDYVTAVTGPQPESAAKLSARPTSQAPNAALIEWAKVAAYSDVQGVPSRPVHFPSDMQNGSRRGEEMVGRAKVLISAGKNPDRPWRVKAAIDPVGDCLPTNSAKALLPRSPEPDAPLRHKLPNETVLYGMFAFMASGFVSAWLDEAAATRNPGADVITAIPAPKPAIMRQLARFGRTLRKSTDKAPALAAIDEQVFNHFEIPNDLRQQLMERLNEADAPEGGRRYITPSDSARNAVSARALRPGLRPAPPMLRSGTIVAISNQTITLDIPGITDEADTVDLPSRMPAALLAPGTAFVVMDSGETVDHLDFRFDEIAHLDDEQILQELRRLTHSTEPGQ